MNDTAVETSVGLTANAVRHVSEILKSEPPGSVLRVSVEGGGCSGFQYIYAIQPAPAEDDLLLSEGDARVAIDPVSLEYLRGSNIDYVEDLMNRAFKIANPAAKSSCGCGTSFSLD